MKIIGKILIIVVILGIFTLGVSAENADSYIADYEEIIPDGYLDTHLNIKEGDFDLSGIFEEIAAIISGKLPQAFSFLLTLIGLCLVMGTANLVPEKIGAISEIGVSVIMGVFVGIKAASSFAEAAKSMTELSEFFSAAIPILSTITLAGGGVKGAAVQAVGMNITLSLVGGGLGAALSLLSGFSLAMGLAFSVGGEGAFSVSRLSVGLFKWIFGIATALLMGFLSLQTLIASSADSAAMRMAKYMASGSIPLVGGTVSASLSTLGAGLSYAKGVVGGSAITILLFIILSPLTMAIVYRLALSLASGFSDLLGIPCASRSLLAFRSSFDMLIGAYCLSGLLYVFQIILFIKSGVAVL